MRTETTLCDLEKCGKTGKPKTLQVIFTTEQTEGRPVKPHIEQTQMDICEDCFQRVLEGIPIYGRGAQGHNNYYFKTNP